MRLQSSLAVLTLAAVLAACGDDARSPLPTQPPTANALVSVTATCDPTLVRQLITQLYPTNPARQTREALLNKFSQGLGFMPNKPTQAWKKFVDILRKVDDDFDAGRLPLLTSPTTAERRAMLYAQLFICAGFEPPEFPTSGDAIVGIIDDPTMQYTFVSTEGDFAVQTPPGMFVIPVVIVGSKQSDGFIVQSIYDEVAIKTEITANPPGQEAPGKKSIVKLCQYEDEFEDDGTDRSFMRIAQRHTESETEIVTVLQFTTGGPFLVCPETAPPSLISGTGFFERSLALAVRALHGARTLAVQTLAPSKLYAASTMVDGGMGGFVDEFFSFYAGVQVPDLRIQSITVGSGASTFEVVVENIGRGQSPPSSLHYSIVNTVTSAIVTQGDVDVDNIEGATTGEEGGPGTETVIFETSTLPTGSYSITVTADFPNDVSELNETAPTPFANNASTHAFAVSPPVITFNGNAGLRTTPVMLASARQ